MQAADFLIVMPETQNYYGKTVVVSGGSGYIGSVLISKLCGTAENIIRISRTENLPITGVADVTGDLTSLETWRCVSEADVVFHLAGETSVYAAAADPVGSLESNVVSVIRAIEATRRSPKHPVLILAGTVTQVGMPETLPVAEGITDAPMTVYDLHKLMAEKHLSLAVNDYGLRGCCLRLANVYGPSTAMSSATDRGVINRQIQAAISGKSLTLFGHGEYLRDYIYINDVISAFLRAGANKTVQNGKGWVISSGNGTTLKEIFELIADRVKAATGTSVPVQHGEWSDNVADIEFRNFVGDSSAFMRETDWKPMVSLSEGIDNTITAFRQGHD